MRYAYISGAVVLVIIGLVFYVFMTPIGVEKPEIKKPHLEYAQEASNSTAPKQGLILEDQHMEYVVNEIDGYKLKENPITREPPVIEVIVDDEHSFKIKVIDNVPTSTDEGEPDLRIRTGKGNIEELLKTDQFKKTVVKMVTDGRIVVELVASRTELASKGYLSIYDALRNSSQMPTGEFKAEFTQYWIIG